MQILLDATRSRDPDFVSTSEQETDTELIWSWECTTQRNARSQACSDKNGTPLSLPSGTARVTLSAGTLAPSTESYLFKVTVSKMGRMPQSFVMPVRTFACFTPVSSCTCVSIHSY